MDYSDVWALCPERATVRAVLAKVAALDLEMHIVNIKNAYLNAPMDVLVYVRQPEGYEVGGDGFVALLRYAMYGCKQEGQLWGHQAHGTLAGLGAVRSQVDPTMYNWMQTAGPAVILLRVDDMSIASSSLADVQHSKEAILFAYGKRDVGAVTTFLGLKIYRDRAARTLTLSCPALTTVLLEEFSMTDAKPFKVSLPVGTSVTRTGTNALPDGGRYAEIVGTFLYLSTSTRPGIFFAAGFLARFMTQPEKGHWHFTKHVFRYFVGPTTFGLRYGTQESPAGPADADHGSCVIARRSTTGWVFTLHGASISWGIKQQPMISSSTAEFDHITAAAVSRGALWLRKLMADLGEQTDVAHEAEDSRECLALVANPEWTGLAKHSDMAHHLKREMVAMGEVNFHYTPGRELVGDGLTKPLSGHTLTEFRKRLGLVGQVTTGTVGCNADKPSGNHVAVGVYAPSSGGGFGEAGRTRAETVQQRDGCGLDGTGPPPE